MRRKKNNALLFLNMHGCVVKDERGVHLADLYEKDGSIVVVKTAACTIGDYLSILTYLDDLGIEAK